MTISELVEDIIDDGVMGVGDRGTILEIGIMDGGVMECCV
jgi:hypothetical protein